MTIFRGEEVSPLGYCGSPNTIENPKVFVGENVHFPLGTRFTYSPKKSSLELTLVGPTGLNGFFTLVYSPKEIALAFTVWVPLI